MISGKRLTVCHKGNMIYKVRQKWYKETIDITYKSDWQFEGEDRDGTYSRSRRLDKGWISLSNAQSNPNLITLSTWDKENRESKRVEAEQACLK